MVGGCFAAQAKIAATCAHQQRSRPLHAVWGGLCEHPHHGQGEDGKGDSTWAGPGQVTWVMSWSASAPPTAFALTACTPVSKRHAECQQTEGIVCKHSPSEARERSESKIGRRAWVEDHCKIRG